MLILVSRLFPGARLDSLPQWPLRSAPVADVADMTVMCASCHVKVNQCSCVEYPCWQGKDDLAGECDRLLQREIQRLDAATVAVGERVLPSSQTVMEAFPSAADGEGPLHLTLFCPPTGHNHTGERGHQVPDLCSPSEPRPGTYL